MKIDIWSDIACPFCYIGKRHLDGALAQFARSHEVEVTMRSFELNPQAKKSARRGTAEHLAEKYGKTLEEARRMNQGMTEMAAAAGLVLRPDEVILTNTFDAHRLLHLAKRHGRQAPVQERLFAAYFTEGKDVGDHAVLRDLAAAAGLEAAEVDHALATDAFADAVRADERQAAELGLHSVPSFVFNGKHLVVGAQRPEVLLGALEQMGEG